MSNCRTPKTSAACRRRTYAGVESSFPEIAAVRRAAQAVIERGELPGVPVTPSHCMPVSGLLEFLVDPARTPAELDAVWEVLIERARRDEDWQVVALGLAAPRLAQIAAKAAGRTVAASRQEIAVAVLTDFTEALLTSTPDPARGLIVHQVLRPAQAAAQRVCDRYAAACRRSSAVITDDAERPGTDEGGASRPNHPDLALARLVAEHVITPDEADLIGRHRIERVTLRDLGAERGWYPMQTSRALRTAEAKVARALGRAFPAAARRHGHVG
ncbi:hypothetical protein [Actinospica robiniae]|uniref:hypothetical protein n=1 Tax=Actinospica robiniae TaxID=304901 RepID=UPI000557EF5B|nr:hypothetical protein [Actinospica robiniae]